MGWGRWLLMGDLGQQLDMADQAREIDALKARLAHERTSDASAADQLARLQAENDELKLYLAGLVRLLVTKGITTRDELHTIVESIDREDGQADGKFQGDLT